MRRLLRGRGGQIIIPAMLLFPTLFLFVYLIYETAKLSREKIRHQFAMDAAAFVEMANYSDFLNRSAYVNGAFPMRIFEEGYYDFPAECEGKVANCNKVSYASILFQNGAFPHVGGTYIDGHSPETSLPGPQWSIEYGYTSDGAPTAKAPQSNRTTMNENPPQTVEPFALFSLNDANHYWQSYDLATEIYKLWFQVYSLLGSVEDAQFTVLTRLQNGPPVHSFLQKSYWLNTGDSMSDAAGLATTFGTQLGNFSGSVHALCQQTLVYCGNRHLGGTGIQPYRPECTDPVVQLQTSAGCEAPLGPGGGLFQVVYLPQSMINNLNGNHGGLYPGLSLSMKWSYPAQNYFNVDWGQQFGNGGPQLHTTISLAGDPVNKPAVWPDPTPKFQVRQYP
jgi:hypothetical protein